MTARVVIGIAAGGLVVASYAALLRVSLRARHEPPDQRQQRVRPLVRMYMLAIVIATIALMVVGPWRPWGAFAVPILVSIMQMAFLHAMLIAHFVRRGHARRRGEPPPSP
jgi:MFS family permease